MTTPEGCGHGGQGGWHDQGAADSLNKSRQKQQCTGGCRCGEDGSQHEDDRAHLQNPLAPDHVPQPTGRQEQGRQDDAVESGHPLGLSQVDVDGSDDGRNGDVDDGRIQHNHGQTQGQHPECTPGRCRLLRLLAAFLTALLHVYACRSGHQISPHHGLRFFATIRRENQPGKFAQRGQAAG